MATKKSTAKKKPAKKIAAKKKVVMTGIHIPDWPEIKGYFTVEDQQHMLKQSGRRIDLYDCKSVLKNAKKIYKQVADGDMPPGDPWDKRKINGFYSWWKSDPTCPS